MWNNEFELTQSGHCSSRDSWTTLATGVFDFELSYIFPYSMCSSSSHVVALHDFTVVALEPRIPALPLEQGFAFLVGVWAIAWAIHPHTCRRYIHPYRSVAHTYNPIAQGYPSIAHTCPHSSKYRSQVAHYRPHITEVSPTPRISSPRIKVSPTLIEVYRCITLILQHLWCVSSRENKHDTHSRQAHSIFLP